MQKGEKNYQGRKIYSLEKKICVSRIDCDNGVHDKVEWFGSFFKCEKCGKTYDYNQLSEFHAGEECTCGEVLMPVPWALDRYFTLRPTCELCINEKKEISFVENFMKKFIKKD